MPSTTATTARRSAWPARPSAWRPSASPWRSRLAELQIKTGDAKRAMKTLERGWSLACAAQASTEPAPTGVTKSQLLTGTGAGGTDTFGGQPFDVGDRPPQVAARRSSRTPATTAACCA